MDCPFCNNSLQSFTINKTVIDICSSCSGVWLDAGELQECIAYLSRRRRFYLPAKKQLFQKPTRIEDVHEPLLLCARCKMPMEKLNYLYSSNIIIDSCTQCGGVWLDRGEAEKITRFSQSSDVVESYGRAVVESVVEKYEQEKQKAKRILVYRIVSGLVACIYLVTSGLYCGAEDTVRLLGFLVCPLTCIWFGDEMGAMTGYFYGYFQVKKTTPGSLVRFMGWLVLFLPVFIFLLNKIV